MELKIIQLGMNTSDLPGTLELYTEALGFRNAGGQAIFGDLIQIQGLDPSSRAMMWWLVGSQSRFQLEFFHHTRPAQRLLPPDWSPADHGWTRFGIAVNDIDIVRGQLAHRGISPLAGEVEVEGLRRFAFRDPYVGVIVEVFERGATQDGPSLVYVACSVSDLASAKAFYGETLGLIISDSDRLHPPGSNALWGLPGARAQSFLADGGEIMIEVVHYEMPAGRPRRSGSLTSDQGVVNVALGTAQKAPMVRTFERLAEAGYTPPHLVETDLMLAGYIIDPEREIELAVIPVELEAALGFAATTPLLGAGI